MNDDIVTTVSSTPDITCNNSPEFKLSENIAALVELKNANITKQTQETTDITSALISLKWMNRHDLHPWIVKEEVYGLILAAVMKAHPERRAQIIERLESHYQRIKTEEAETLSITRSLAEDHWQSSLL